MPIGSATSATSATLRSATLGDANLISPYNICLKHKDIIMNVIGGLMLLMTH
jgi:hypothetical protein